MKKILILIIYFILIQIYCRYLYFIKIDKIAPNETIYHLSKTESINSNIPHNYIWTKSSFIKQEFSSILKRIPIGSIGDHKRKGSYTSNDIELKKYTGIYYFLIFLGLYFILFFDFTVFRNNKKNSS